MILDGKKAAESLFDKLQEQIRSLPSIPVLAAVQVGDNPASSMYIRIKQKKLNELGLGFEHIQLPENSRSEDIESAIQKLNARPEIRGILLQLPLPHHLDTRMLLDTIDPKKDIDCLTSTNLGTFFTGSYDVMPATPLGVVRLLEYYEIPIEGKRIAVLGRSNLVGKPLSIALLHKSATVTMCHSKTQNLHDITQASDIVISAMGQPEFLDSSYFKQGHIIIDVGTSKGASGKIVGDVAFDAVKDLVAGITPVPGGVGPMTIYGLIENFVTLSSGI